jgi:hypothetical protein
MRLGLAIPADHRHPRTASPGATRWRLALPGWRAAAPDKLIRPIHQGDKTHERHEYVEVKGTSDGLTWTSAEEVNAHLVPFLA